MASATLVIRQDSVITQVIQLPQTTFTTRVVLSAATQAPVATSNHENTGGLTDAEIGAIVGAMLGVFILVVVIICCCCRRRLPQTITMPRTRGSYGSSYASDGWSEPPPKIRYVSPNRRPYFAPEQPRRPKRVRHARGTFEAREYVRPVPAPFPRGVPMVPTAPMEPQHVTWPPGTGQRELIPGAPKFPTYRALPIPNPRKAPKVRHFI